MARTRNLTGRKAIRRNPTKAQRERLLANNGRMCCVCKVIGAGLELHHIDGNHANTTDDNLAVLCVVDHDAHHRPGQYRIRHVELGSEEILNRKQDWEAFIREAREPKPRLLATVSGYGTYDYIHSAKVTYQWTSGCIVFKRVYHQLSSGNLDDWTTDIVEESVRLGRNIPLALLNEPLEIEQCPCCHKRLSKRDSVGRIYINPSEPSLAFNFSLEERFIFSGSLHLCRETQLHFHCEDYDERHTIKRMPSVRTQVTSLMENLLKNMGSSPAPDRNRPSRQATPDTRSRPAALLGNAEAVESLKLVEQPRSVKSSRP